MAENTLHTQPDSGFHAILTQHRSLSPTGFMILMAIVGCSSFVLGMVFLSMGAWPVFGFLGLDVLLLYIAFKLNYRAGRLFELVDVTREQLVVTRVHPNGRRESFEFNPFWARVLLREWPDGRTELRVTGHGRELLFGQFLTDDERRDFASALKGALIEARGARI
ncbi:MAG: DUF2244 domain-containing protein [Pseudomonadota bacterium]|jgi:uncharacterized membrane protein|nr:MAG: DUF2244 domain-containing protein [Pseudomonadota bacterium]